MNLLAQVKEFLLQLSKKSIFNLFKFLQKRNLNDDFRVLLISLIFVSVNICDSNLPEKKNVVIFENHKKQTIFAANFMHLKKNLLSNNFDPHSIANLIANLSKSLGWEWYDQKAKVEISYIKNNSKNFIVNAHFIGAGKIIDLNYTKPRENNTHCLPSTASNLAVLKGFVGKNLDSMLSNAKELPFILRKNVLQFSKQSNIKAFPGDRFFCIYDPAKLNVIAMFIDDGKRKKAAVFYNSASLGSRIFNKEGISLKGEKLVFFKPVVGRLSSPYGYRFHPVLKIYRFHTGVDYAAPKGTPVTSPASGKIIFAGKLGGYGNCIKIKHDHNIITLYGHLQRIPSTTYVGKKVQAKEFIATVGSTGLSSGPHLHYEIWINNKRIDPLKFYKEVYKSLKGGELEEYRMYLKKLYRTLD